MADLHYRGRIEALDIAFSYAVTTDLAGEAIRRHDCDPVAGHVLGRAITAGLLATSTLNEHERINIRWAYQGLLRAIVVDAGPDGTARALISPEQLADCPDKTALYGEGGEIRVVRSRDGKILGTGTVQTALNDVVNDLAYFQCISDQVETATAVLIGFSADPGHPVRLCRGLSLQALPGSDLMRFQRIREHLEGDDARILLSREAESDNLFEDILNRLTRDETSKPAVQLTACPAPVFRCTCHRDKMGAVLRSLPYSDRMDIVQKKEDVVVHCQFCRQRYVLTVDECIRAWNEKAG